MTKKDLEFQHDDAWDGGDYKTLCTLAVAQEDIFKKFRRSPTYTDIVETVPYWQGFQYLEIIRSHYPELTSSFDLFRKNDEFGGSQIFDYGLAGDFAPTTLRYIKVLGDLKRLFGSLDKMRIVEIG